MDKLLKDYYPKLFIIIWGLLFIYNILKNIMACLIISHINVYNKFS